MFDKPNGGLIYFPENVMWPVNGKLELLSHLRSRHRPNYDLDRTFYGCDSDAIIGTAYHVYSGVAS